jgi:hydrogenase expression/formation protein HypD
MDRLQNVISYLANYNGRPLKLMEVCGTHTSSIAKNGIRSMISPKIRLCSGPGCPVCVTPQGYIDKLCSYSMEEDTIVLTFGDMMKVPGSKDSLSDAKAKGGKIDIFYSPFEVIEKAKKTPELRYIIAAVGFETTVPVYALMMEYIIKEEIKNIKFLTALKVIVPVLEILCSEENNIDGFIAPGHVSTIIGSDAYTLLTKNFQKPFAVSGFSAEEVLVGIYDLVKQIENGKYETHNLYRSAVNSSGNIKARLLMDKYFQSSGAFWRGVGELPDSGLYLKDNYEQFDAGSRNIENNYVESFCCKCSDVIMGRIDPSECEMFGKSCTPAKAMGPCMVSSEGACGIWYKAYFNREHSNK